MNRHPSARIGTKKLASMNALSVARRPSVDLGQAEDLARVYQIGVANLIFVGIEDLGVMPACAVMRARDVPQIVAPHHVQPFAVAPGSRRHGGPFERQFETGDGLAV